MEIKIKDTLRALRQQKNVTQEALANHLGITPQSVGKWERDEGFPDITLLVNRLINDPSASTKNFKGNACNMRLSGLQWNCYDFIREEERFKAIVAKLEEFAE